MPMNATTEATYTRSASYHQLPPHDESYLVLPRGGRPSAPRGQRAVDPRWEEQKRFVEFLSGSGRDFDGRPTTAEHFAPKALDPPKPIYPPKNPYPVGDKHGSMLHQSASREHFKALTKSAVRKPIYPEYNPAQGVAGIFGAKQGSMSMARSASSDQFRAFKPGKMAQPFIPKESFNINPARWEAMGMQLKGDTVPKRHNPNYA